MVVSDEQEIPCAKEIANAATTLLEMCTSSLPETNGVGLENRLMETALTQMKPVCNSLEQYMPGHDSDAVGRILFVDDDPNFLKTVERLFHRRRDLSLQVASGAAEALRTLRHDMIAVLVADHYMPGIPGIELMGKARHLAPDTTRVLMTGRASLDLAIRSVNSGEVFRFVVKPCKPDELLRVVDDALDRHRIILYLNSGDEAKLLSLAQTIELKGHYARGHCERVAVYAGRIASELKMSPEDMKLTRYGCWLHDCGKIGIPEEVLNKPDVLDPEEREIVKLHPRWSGDVAMSAGLPDMVVNIAVYHHERWDGRGYPFGLSGTAIPREARIVAIADVYDALTTDKPYRKKLTAKQAIRILLQNRGRAFDPDLTSLFASIMRTAQGESRPVVWRKH